MEMQKEEKIEREEKLKATRTVYCYYFPEIRKIIDEIVRDYPHNVFLSSIKPGLDDFHIPVVEKFIKYNEKNVPNLNDFKFRYFTDGSSQGIFHLLVKFKFEEPKTTIYTLKGEYEGYKEYAIRIGTEIKEIEENADFAKLQPGIFFISNPSGRNGNIIPNEFIEEICKYHRVVYDFAYLGLTKEHVFNISNKNIIAIVASMSKPFGMYYYRAGFAFAREPLETLVSNKWFKNIFSIILTDRILDKIQPEELYKKYRPVQERIINKINNNLNIGLKVSDVMILANTNKFIEGFMRDKFCRLCLTPYFLEEESEGRKNEI